ncbi:MAG: flavodoxin family protein [Promethearchaeota archaeon]
MKALISYFTMGRRAKKIAEAIASVLIDYEIDYVSLELTGKFSQRLKELRNFNKGDFSLIEPELNRLDLEGYELIIIGMPNHGGFPPKVFDEILTRMGNIHGKHIVVFNTARLTGSKAHDYMRNKVEEAGGQVIVSTNFKGFFRLGIKNAAKFGKQIIENQ